MKLLTLQELQTIAEAYIDETKIGVKNWKPDQNFYTGLLEKIIASIMIDGDYTEDLGFMDGFRIETGESIEEYFIGFASPENQDDDGTNNDKPAYPDALPSTYSVRFDPKIIKVSERYNKLQNSFNSETDFRNYVTRVVKRLYDSLTLYLNELKRELLGKIANRAVGGEATAWANNHAYKRGDMIKSGTSPDLKVGVALKDFTSATSYQNDVTNGNILELRTFETIAAPTDTTTGEAFIKSIKGVAETFKYPDQGDSLNGNIAGVAPKYILLLKQGIMPSLQVDTFAGAFNPEQLSFEVEQKVVKNFGSNENVIAMLIDERAVKLHNCSRFVLTHLNADGAFMNHVLHDEELGFYSPNTKIHVWTKA